jgi:hypothetical protein
VGCRPGRGLRLAGPVACGADAALNDVQAEKAEDLLERTLKDVQEIVSVTKATPTKITLYTAPDWKKEMLRLAVAAASGGKLDMGALMKQAMATPAIAEHKFLFQTLILRPALIFTGISSFLANSP